MKNYLSFGEQDHTVQDTIRQSTHSKSINQSYEAEVNYLIQELKNLERNNHPGQVERHKKSRIDNDFSCNNKNPIDQIKNSSLFTGKYAITEALSIFLIVGTFLISYNAFADFWQDQNMNNSNPSANASIESGHIELKLLNSKKNNISLTKPGQDQTISSYDLDILTEVDNSINLKTSFSSIPVIPKGTTGKIRIIDRNGFIVNENPLFSKNINQRPSTLGDYDTSTLTRLDGNKDFTAQFIVNLPKRANKNDVNNLKTWLDNVSLNLSD